MSPAFDNLRCAIYGNTAEYKRFRQLVVNCVMATDIVDKDLSAARKARWETAFTEQTENTLSHMAINRKATIVIEHLIQASDVVHTMQHWVSLATFQRSDLVSWTLCHFMTDLTLNLFCFLSSMSTANGMRNCLRRCTVHIRRVDWTPTQRTIGIKESWPSSIIVRDILRSGVASLMRSTQVVLLTTILYLQ
jgi:hypothetical protein